MLPLMRNLNFFYLKVINEKKLINTSVNFGTSFADSWLISRGGADTGIYQIFLKAI